MSMNRMENVLFDGFQREAMVVLKTKITADEVMDMMNEKFNQDAGLMLEESVID